MLAVGYLAPTEIFESMLQLMRFDVYLIELRTKTNYSYIELILLHIC